MNTRARPKTSTANTVRAHIRRGIIAPVEALDLPDGEEVLVTIFRAPSTGTVFLGRSRREAFRRVAGGWNGTMNAEALIRRIYRDRVLPNRPAPRLYATT